MRHAVLAAAVLAALSVPASAGAAPKPTKYSYDVPTQATSPWPSMRRDRRNTGASPIAGVYLRGDKPWRFRTAKGIFSTPVLGGDGAVYVGSADGNFYALEQRTGRERWRFRTGGIIDAAAVIGAYDKKLRTTPITIGSGDEVLYKLRTDRARISRSKRTIWRFLPTIKPATGQIVNWWEGNVALGFDGTLYAGNTGGGTYAINQDGKQRWAYKAGNSVWTTPAFARDGTTFWGSVDLSIFALDKAGKKKWAKTTIGFNTSSPALSPDEKTLYVGSFDANLYALDAATGADRWSFKTRDHIYSSPALGKDTVYVGSTDGSVYAVDAKTGKQRWRYDTGDPVRSSPVLGGDPSGKGQILYVGSSDGRLYALDAETGMRRWSYDTTPTDPVLEDRNDLNGSPALGTRGVYIGGEHGDVTFVPYDYCLKAKDARCETSPAQPFGDTIDRVFPVSPGGATLTKGYPGALNPSAVVNGRHVVRRDGQTQDVGLTGDASSLVKAEPPFPFSAQLSPDGRHIFVAPTGFLKPSTPYAVRIAGDTVRFRTAPLGPPRLKLGGSEVTALSLSRLAIPLPPFLTSVNQIGFDSYDWIAGTAALGAPDANGEGTVTLWVIGAKRNAQGVPVPDRSAGFAFPLSGRYRGDSLLLSQKNLRLTFSFGDVPMRRFDVRMQLDKDLRAANGANIYAEVTCSDVPTYGPVLPLIGLCNPTNTLAVSGTLLSDRYDRRGTANRRPAGVAVTSLTRAGDTVTASLSGTYPAKEHIVSILLVDPATGEPLAIDHPRATKTETDAAGNIARVSVTLPPGAPQRLKACVMTDVFPLAVRDLSE